MPGEARVRSTIQRLERFAFYLAQTDRKTPGSWGDFWFRRTANRFGKNRKTVHLAAFDDLDAPFRADRRCGGLEARVRVSGIGQRVEEDRMAFGRVFRGIAPPSRS